MSQINIKYGQCIIFRGVTLFFLVCGLFILI